MPIWLRKFTFVQIKNHYEEENNKLNKQSTSKDSQNILNSSGKISPPNFQNKTSYK